MKRIVIIFISILLIAGLVFVLVSERADLAQPKVLSFEDSLKMKADTLLKMSTPMMGYRFVIYGDFDGDRKMDTLYERYTDSVFLHEAPKYYVSADTNFEYDDVIFLSEYENRKSFLEWGKRHLKLGGGQLGFHYIENCGDINSDGKDEVLFVQQYSDWSNLNTAHVYSLIDNKWKEIYSTHVWEWQFPLTPSVSMLPGMMGDYNYASVKNDSANEIIKKTLNEFKFIKYYKDHSIEFSGMNSIPVWDDENARAELDSLGQQEYFKKYYDKVYINDSVYLRDKANTSIHYKVSEEKISKTESVILFGIDNPAEMVTTRIYINNPKSPFKGE